MPDTSAQDALFGAIPGASRKIRQRRGESTDTAALGLRPAVARLVNSSAPDMHDSARRPLAFLVVECPFCDHQHVHPGGHVGAPRLGQRRARCIGRPGGAYYLPEVQS
jgi:hypothetical protein